MARAGSICCVTALIFAAAAHAGPWAEVGDAQTRSDVELAAAYGLVNNVTMQWPMPWTGIMAQLQDEHRIAELPPEVREAATRLLAKGADDLHVGRARADLTVDVTNAPATVRGYDGLGRTKAESQVDYEYLSSATALRLAVGAKKSTTGDSQTLVLDSSYIAHRIDGMIVYAGYLSHWWGPGWISALSLSNNMRPMPQIGVSRVETEPSSWWLLNWMGPWQAEAFIGILDGPRIARNTGYVAIHVAFNPLPGFEIGMSRTTEICGSGHDCRPLVDYFTFSNDPSHVNETNDQGSIELRYTGTALSHPYALYAQFMNEDTNPIIHSATSKVAGATVWLPVDGMLGRFTLEYANSIPTTDIWGNGTLHGAAYNNWDFVDGMRYRGRSLGFSLDSDSILYSAQASLIDDAQRTWTVAYHRADVSSSANSRFNVVTTAPVQFNALEAKLSMPLRWGEYAAHVDVASRWQDDQPRPQSGSQFGFEVAFRVGI
jgi:hypothetical protein